ncbi:uncharacterized protein LOC117180890 isoform X2 [Belonocnema kinseyi]|uniref:uncharacterized protein LOC117180890 isoform X2 n=1 Tax=Belonocnema kinseyi TaxID=2817044 RepID=UPI00143DEA70|nr:uncharacterized protein LOC117180890 isoform X2 [Belonocnema kinseyi]
MLMHHRRTRTLDRNINIFVFLLNRMAKILLLLCLAFIVATTVAGEENEQKPLCSPLFGYCQSSFGPFGCCRNLICLGYAAKCIALSPGQLIPGDSRPNWIEY